MFLKVVEIIILLAALLLILTQVVIPLWSNRKVFPIFRKQKFSAAVVDVNELSDKIAIGKALKEKTAAIKKEME